MGATRFVPISQREETIASHIVNSAYLVHKQLGPGLLEKVYEACFCHELRKAGFTIRRQLDVPIIYDGLVFDEALRLDVLVEDLVICELKAVDQVNPVWGSAGAQSSQADRQASWVSHQL